MPISPTITEDDFRGKLQAWRETTTTSPSGLHLGHYKALFAKHSFSHIPEEEDEEPVHALDLRIGKAAESITIFDEENVLALSSG